MRFLKESFYNSHLSDSFLFPKIISCEYSLSIVHVNGFNYFCSEDLENETQPYYFSLFLTVYDFSHQIL